MISSHRNHRPWHGEVVGEGVRPTPAHDPACYLCPGNARVSGQVNPAYTGVYAFDNDHPCVGPGAPEPEPSRGILQARRADGLSRVVCFTPRHDLTLAELSLAEVEALLEAWAREYRDLGARPEVTHVHVFENKGDVVGVSNPHPHCQVYATNFTFRTIEVEADASRAHHARTGRALLADVMDAEASDARRLVVPGDSAMSFVPYFARYPYETYIAPRAPHASLADVPDAERVAFARVLHETLVRMDNLWRMSFPYVLVLHQAPTDGAVYPGFHFHVQVHPPLRKPGLLKYLAGPEVGGGNFLNDTAPEEKAAELRAVSAVHYRHAGA